MKGASMLVRKIKNFLVSLLALLYYRGISVAKIKILKT